VNLIKNAVFWGVTPCGSWKNRPFGELSALIREALSSSETSVFTRAARRNIPEDGILHSHSRENLKSYIALTGWTLLRRRNVSPVRYELGFYIPEDNILHSHRRENLKSYISGECVFISEARGTTCGVQPATKPRHRSISGRQVKLSGPAARLLQSARAPPRHCPPPRSPLRGDCYLLPSSRPTGNGNIVFKFRTRNWFHKLDYSG
jgi:hypothetical protein